jgi:hypothetical protein
LTWRNSHVRREGAFLFNPHKFPLPWFKLCHGCVGRSYFWTDVSGSKSDKLENAGLRHVTRGKILSCLPYAQKMMSKFYILKWRSLVPVCLLFSLSELLPLENLRAREIGI